MVFTTNENFSPYVFTANENNKPEEFLNSIDKNPFCAVEHKDSAQKDDEGDEG